MAQTSPSSDGTSPGSHAHGHAHGHDPHRHRIELMREANTMAVYVAVCLIGGLAAIPHPHEYIAVAIWGLTIGLAVTHWFAFRLASRLVGEGHVSRADIELGAAQVFGAAVVGILATLAAILVPERWELRAIGITLGAFIAAIAYHAVRRGGGQRHRAITYAFAMLFAAIAVAELKTRLSGK